MESSLLLSTKNLSVGYVQRTLFNDLNLSLKQGELVCFMGPNGIGKSTLLRTLAGLHPALQGAIHVDSVESNGGATPTKIAVVLTDKITAVNMTVRELVAFGRYPYLDWNIRLTQEDNQIIDRVITVTNIQPLLTKKLYELSDGQLQMTMIARALAQDTPILLLDEPTAHLDLNNRVEIMNLLRNLARQEKKAILVSTHELDLALQTADRIWLAGTQQDILTGIPEDLVLNGSFDEIFRFKGFDLKTGKIYHESFRNISVQLEGDGYEYLWTKNALERTGFSISTSSSSDYSIKISKDRNQIVWEVQGNIFDSLFALLQHLNSN